MGVWMDGWVDGLYVVWLGGVQHQHCSSADGERQRGHPALWSNRHNPTDPTLPFQIFFSESEVKLCFDELLVSQ